MGWLEDALDYKKYLEAAELNSSNSFRAEKPYELMKNYSEPESISISMDEFGTAFSLKLLQEKAHQLKSLSVFGVGMNMESNNILSFPNLESLTLTVSGYPEKMIFQTPALKTLKIYWRDWFSPMEVLCALPAHIDLSQCPKLQTLELRHCPKCDPSNFSDRKELKKLTITYSTIQDLNWLMDTSYQLENLYIDGELENCDGIAYQTNLQYLALNHTAIRDWTPLSKLGELSYLDLRNNDIRDISALTQLKNLRYLNLKNNNIEREDLLRNMGIPSLIITQKDDELAQIKGRVHSIGKDVMRGLHHEAKQSNIIDIKSPEWIRKAKYKRSATPVEELLKEGITARCKSDIKKVATDGPGVEFIELSACYLEYYKKEAISYYPFLSDALSDL